MAAMDKVNLAVVVLSFNGRDSTLECIKSLKIAKKDNINLRIIVVDNASADDSLNALQKIKDIDLVVNYKNLGFSGGMNRGIEYALKHNATHIMLLNNDTVIDKDLLINIVRTSVNADIISPKIYFSAGHEFHKERYQKTDLGKVIWYSGGSIDWKNILGVHAGVDEVDTGQFDKPMEITFATGCCILIKRQVFKKIGLLDEKYFLYLEDMDFCYRAQKAGFKILFDPQSILWHKNASAAGGSGSVLQEYYFTRNRLLFAFKHASIKMKAAVLRQAFRNIANPIRRQALLDFLTFHYGKK